MKTQLILALAIVVLFFGSLPSTFATTANFQALPGVGWQAISADGSIVVGGNYRWTALSGSHHLGTLPGALSSSAHGVSADGSVIVGNSGGKPFLWTETGGMQEIDIGAGYSGGSANAVSADGSVVVGYGKTPTGSEAIRWTVTSGVQGLGYLPGEEYISSATGVSSDGTVVVGASKSELSGPYNYEAFRWTSYADMVGIGELPTWYRSIAWGVSADGKVTVGYCIYSGGTIAFRWTESGVVQLLGDLDGGRRESTAYAVSADGSTIVGSSVTSGSTDDMIHEAFVWDEAHGIRNLKDVLETECGLDLTGWLLTEAKGVSADGLTIIGNGYNPDGIAQGWIATITEPATPPIADADGPYTIYVGDTLTLDASGSTDDYNDIVSYVWDLDNNGSFETDARGQPVFDVNYTYLQSLGLIVDHTYDIHLKVTDSEGQSDVNDSTLTIVPKPAIEVAVDIKPGSCPNPVNVKSKGVLPIAILGTVDYDVTTIDPASIRLAGVEPLRSGYEDVATPVSDSNDCNCMTEGPDGFLDLTLKFKTQRIVEAIGDVNDGDVLELPLTGVLSDETPIEGADCILIRGRHKPINPADINKDGVVNAADFAIFAQNWLQSSIVDE